MILTGLQQALSAHGSPVTTENGWQGRGRGQMSSVKTITIHHTAGGNDAGDLKVVRDGRSDLPGPLAQILLRRNGIPRIIANIVKYCPWYEELCGTRRPDWSL